MYIVFCSLNYIDQADLKLTDPPWPTRNKRACPVSSLNCIMIPQPNFVANAKGYMPNKS